MCKSYLSDLLEAQLALQSGEANISAVTRPTVSPIADSFVSALLVLQDRFAATFNSTASVSGGARDVARGPSVCQHLRRGVCSAFFVQKKLIFRLSVACHFEQSIRVIFHVVLQHHVRYSPSLFPCLQRARPGSPAERV